MVRSTKYVCQQCDYETSGWLGRCPSCQSWGSLVETVVSEIKNSKIKGKSGKFEIVELAKVKAEGLQRISTGIGELDNILGGGLVLGQTVLLAGEPGIGKSTLLSQVTEKIYPEKIKKTVYYVSGEESANQVKLRAKRLGFSGVGVFVIEETDVDGIIEILKLEAASHLSHLTSLVIIDSIQTLTTSNLTGSAGSIGQVRETANRVVSFCKRENIPVFLVGHVTKEGAIAGPRVLEHMVDTVVWFEGDRSQSLRILRTIKNRFGPTDEVGIFNMGEKGLSTVDNPNLIFTSGIKNVPGQVATVLLEGTRPIVTEIQALVVPTKFPYPKRVVQGVDLRRIEILLAVLTRRAGLPIGGFDVLVNVAGGISIHETGADLAIALSIASAWSDKPVAPTLAAYGEVGLLGEIRAVPQEARRTKEARRLGFRNVITRTSARTIGEVIKKYLR